MPRRTAIVTGARRGIGAAIAEALLETGAHVVVCGRHIDRVRATVAALHGRGLARAEAFAGDLGTADGRALLIESFDRIDVLVNNVGGFLRASSTTDATEQEWEEQLRINLTLPFLLCQAVLPGMLQRGWGRIVNVGSVVATAPQRGNAIGYVAAKTGLVGFTRQLALEVAGTGVTANVLNPGTVATEHLAEYFAASTAVRGQDSSLRVPMGRFGRPREIAALVPYLASDDAAFLTGAVIDVNGGAVTA